MNLDTSLKRLSGINVSCPWRGQYPFPDGSVTQPDRQVTAFMYSGIASTPPAATAAITGTIFGATEADIRAGGRTIIITLANDSWVAAGATFNAQRQNIINGLTSAGSELLGWNNVVKALQSVAGVVRSSGTVVTITLDAFPTYDITANETITDTIPASALTTSLTAVVGIPAFTVSFIPVQVAGGGGAGTWQRLKSEPNRRDARGSKSAPSHVPVRDLREPEDIPEIRREAKAVGDRTAEEIIASHREISRIKTQMRLTDNAAAMRAMEAEISKIEAHLAKVKAEDDAFLFIFMM